MTDTDTTPDEDERRAPAGIALPSDAYLPVPPAPPVDPTFTMAMIARQFPRDVKRARKAMRRACKDPQFARKAFFEIEEEDGTVYRGPSVHLARELARCWGHITFDLREVSRDMRRRVSTMVVHAWDLQTNARASSQFEVPHVRSDEQDGVFERLVDPFEVYENNADHGARRLRECIFQVLPAWFVAEAEKQCEQTLRKQARQHVEAVGATEIVQRFEQIGVTAVELMNRLSKPQDNWTAEDTAELKELLRQIEDGEVSVTGEFEQTSLTSDEIRARKRRRRSHGDAEDTSATA